MLISTDPHVPNLHSFIHPSAFKLEADASVLENFVRRLPAAETAFVCAKLNLLFSDLMRKDVSHINQLEILRWLFNEGWVTLKDRDFLFAYMKKHPSEFLFARQSLLEMIRWLALWGSPISKFSYNDTKRQSAFVRALILCGEFSTRTQKSLLLTGDFDDADNDKRHFLTLPVFRECSLFQVPPYDPLFCLGRHKELFVECFLTANPEYLKVLEEELAMTLDDYIACLVGLGSIITSWSNRGIGFSLRTEFEFNSRNPGETTLMQSQLLRFLELEGATLTEFSQSFLKNADPSVQLDLKILREKPILLGADGRATFVDESFFMEKASSGLLFRLAKKLGDEPLQRFGYAFEDYARRKLDKYVKALQKNRLVSKGYGPIFATENGEKREFTDYLFVDDSTVVLVEMKAVWSPDAIVGNADYWGELMKRYGVSTTSRGKKKKKGVAQLAQAIRKWLDGKLVLDPEIELPASISRVIPVLLVHDPHLSTLSHGRFLADEFGKLLLDRAPELSRSEMSVNGIPILNLCILTIDEFEYFEGKILSKTFSDLLLTYSGKYKDRMVSAGRFLANLDPEPNAREPLMVEARNIVIDAACMKLFGRSPERVRPG